MEGGYFKRGGGGRKGGWEGEEGRVGGGAVGRWVRGWTTQDEWVAGGSQPAHSSPLLSGVEIPCGTSTDGTRG